MTDTEDPNIATLRALLDDPLDPSVSMAAGFAALSALASTLAERDRRIACLETGLLHISETCIEDPDTAQFAFRLVDGSAYAPGEDI